MIRDANDIGNSALIQPGQTLNIPAVPIPNNNSNTATSETNTDDGKIYHIVQKGENLWSIAEKYYGKGHKYNLIKTANPHVKGILKPGMKLLIPKD